MKHLCNRCGQYSEEPEYLAVVRDENGNVDCDNCGKRSRCSLKEHRAGFHTLAKILTVGIAGLLVR